jgi:translation initiation factor 5B
LQQLEKERLEKERKDKKKLKEKQRIERLKQEGKYLTKAQKESKERALRQLEALGELVFF